MDQARNRSELLERLLKGYETYFDTERFPAREDGLPLAARCSFHVHSEKYVLVKKAQLWAADSNEYVFIFSVPVLTEEIFARCLDFAVREGMKEIHPGPGHMYSCISPVFLCDSSEKEGEKALKRCRIYKSFRFSWYGWMNVHTAALIREGNRVITNRMGRGSAKFMKDILKS